MKVGPRVRQALEALGRPYEIVPGGKHWKVLVEGRLLTIIGRSINETGRHDANTAARIRRAARAPR